MDRMGGVNHLQDDRDSAPRYAAKDQRSTGLTRLPRNSWWMVVLKVQSWKQPVLLGSDHGFLTVASQQLRPQQGVSTRTEELVHVETPATVGPLQSGARRSDGSWLHLDLLRLQLRPEDFITLLLLSVKASRISRTGLMLTVQLAALTAANVLQVQTFGGCCGNGRRALCLCCSC